ncbi:MAG: OadG family protein, partial [Lachnospiraceae bacterium]|nr:OadG family protein [Lachnospiraceae bacterium]
MKKFIYSLLAALCLMSLTACGNQVEKEPVMQQEAAENVGLAVAQYLVAAVDTGEEENFKLQFYSANGSFYSVGLGLTGTEVADKAVESLKSALEDTGSINYADINSATSVISPERADVTVDLVGELKNAKMEISIEGNKYEGYKISNIATNVDYTMGEKMSKAFMNLLLGMGMAFAVLILISLVISFLPGIDSAISGRKKKKSEKN